MKQVQTSTGDFQTLCRKFKLIGRRIYTSICQLQVLPHTANMKTFSFNNCDRQHCRYLCDICIHQFEKQCSRLCHLPTVIYSVCMHSISMLSQDTQTCATRQMGRLTFCWFMQHPLDSSGHKELTAKKKKFKLNFHSLFLWLPSLSVSHSKAWD